jgi:hypothetical protein
MDSKDTALDEKDSSTAIDDGHSYGAEILAASVAGGSTPMSV